jgi:hypothetical protein
MKRGDTAPRENEASGFTEELVGTSAELQNIRGIVSRRLHDWPMVLLPRRRRVVGAPSH